MKPRSSNPLVQSLSIACRYFASSGKHHNGQVDLVSSVVVVVFGGKRERVGFSAPGKL